MQQLYDKISFCVGDERVLKNMPEIKALPIFDDKILGFLEELSNALLKHREIKQYPDVAAYAFWIRKKNMLNEKSKYEKDFSNRLGRGYSFHIAPSNIPVQFAVSLVYGLLSGNACCIRISNKDFRQVEMICDEINKLLNKDYTDLKSYIVICRFQHDKELTDLLSKKCDARIIWGGDATVNSIKKSPVPPRTVELCFSDRYSIAIINSDELFDGRWSIDVIANDFYIDTYNVDQNACSSPRLVLWMGKRIEEAKEVFWRKLEEKVEREYEASAISGIDKLDKCCQLAAKGMITSVETKNNRLCRVGITEISENIMDYKGAEGFFFEYSIKDFCEIVPLLKKECQSVLYYGIDRNELLNCIVEYGVRGVDRIVPLGHALDLSFKWDGFDMINSLSRNISF